MTGFSAPSPQVGAFPATKESQFLLPERTNQVALSGTEPFQRGGEALFQDNRMTYYAQEAYDILDDALEKMVGEMISTDPDCRTIEQLIEKHDTQLWTQA
jgi:hypothetical protein